VSDLPVCPVCDSAGWSPNSETTEYCYKGQEFTLDDIEWSVCEECGYEVVLPAQSKKNDSRVRNEHRRIDELLAGVITEGFS